MSGWTRNASNLVALNKKTLMNAKESYTELDRVKPSPPPFHVISVKVTLVGNTEVGKTSLALRYCRGTTEENLKTTLAVDWLHHSVTLHNRKVNLQIWDTAGQEKFMAVIPSFIRDSGGVLLVYDVTDARSYTSKTMWLDMVKKEVPGAVVILVANKVDKTPRIISTQEGERFATENGLHYMETSAITGHNVKALFYDLAEKILFSWNALDDDKTDNIKLTEESRTKKKCPC